MTSSVIIVIDINALLLVGDHVVDELLWYYHSLPRETLTRFQFQTRAAVNNSKRLVAKKNS